MGVMIYVSEGESQYGVTILRRKLLLLPVGLAGAFFLLLVVSCRLGRGYFLLEVYALVDIGDTFDFDFIWARKLRSLNADFGYWSSEAMSHLFCSCRPLGSVPNLIGT